MGRRWRSLGRRWLADARVEIIGEALRYASRGGLKLEGALEDFAVSPQGRVCLDVGSSTGGFTDCLLQHGAVRVFAVDVTVDQLDWKLRQDPRVTTVELNARYLKARGYCGAACAGDYGCVFISVAKVLPAVVPVAAAGRGFFDIDQAAIRVGEKRNRQGRDRAGCGAAPESDRAGSRRPQPSTGWTILGVRPSHLPGTEGNQEFFLHARARG